MRRLDVPIINAFRLAATAASSIVLIARAGAHHRGGTFDDTKTIELTGKLTRTELINPHSWPFVVSFFSRTVIFAALASTTLAAQGGPYERQKIDDAAAARGRAVYAQHCINCHGSSAKGTDRGPDLIRSVVVLRDRLGSGIGPAIGPSATHQATLTSEQVVDLSHFLHQRIEAIASNRSPRIPINVLTGDIEAGKAYFHGAGTCSTCHSETGDLKGLATRITDPVALQQRWLFPTLRRGRREVDVTVAGKNVSGALVRLDDFSVTLKDASGADQSFNRGQGVTVVVRDPLAAHRTLLDRYTDTNMHDMTTYLWTLK